MRSLWQQHSFSNHSDIVIVGAGLTGLLTAIKIKQSKPEHRIIILEKGLYPDGATARNAGFACFGSVSEILDDIEHEGESLAYKRVIDRYKGLQMLFDTVPPEKIDLKQQGGIEVFTPAEKQISTKSLEALAEINKRLNPELGFNPFQVMNKNFGMATLPQSIRINKEGTLHSGKLLKALIDKANSLGVEISFGSEVISVENKGKYWLVKSHTEDYKCEKILLATNGYTSALLPELPVKAARGQILVTSKIKNLQIDRSFHLHQGYYYFRNFDGRIMLGGGRHLDRENEFTTDIATTTFIQNELERVLREIILPDQDFEIDYRWAGTMAFGPANEKEPIVEEFQPGLFVATRLGGMGVAMSSLVAEKSKNLILN